MNKATTSTVSDSYFSNRFVSAAIVLVWLVVSYRLTIS